MIDLHTHSIFSDGELIPYELIRRAEAAGYTALAITDHVDISNIDHIVPRIKKAVNALPAGTALKRARDKSDFARRLIRNLGTSSYGVWKEKRYAHTRRAVRKAGLWDAKLVSALMPAKL